MTDDIFVLKLVLEKCQDADSPRAMIGYEAERLRELEVVGLTGAARREESQ